MALIKTREQREVEMLQKVERELERREKRERIHKLLIGGLALMTIGTFIGGMFSGRHCAHRR